MAESLLRRYSFSKFKIKKETRIEKKKTIEENKREKKWWENQTELGSMGRVGELILSKKKINKKEPKKKKQQKRTKEKIK